MMWRLLLALLVLAVVYEPDFSWVRERPGLSTYDTVREWQYERQLRDYYRRQQPIIIDRPAPQRRVICIRSGKYVNCFYR